MQVRDWPRQKDCVSFYGDPFAKGFEAKNIVVVKTPFQMFYGVHRKTSVKSHRKCAEAVGEWFEQIWKNADRKQWVINAWGLASFSGDFVIRQKRGGSTPSMHSFGCAWDFDAARNGFKDHTPHFATPAIHDAVVKPFKALGGTWGGDWPNNTDGMHFQFADVS